MNKLWAPWRSKYIYDRKKKRCIFCIPKKTQKKRDRALHIIERSRYSFLMLNRYPYNNGHVMVSPYRHVKSIEHLKPEELNDMMKLVAKYKRLLDKLFKPDGYNIGINVGRVAGAGFAGHVHIHVVPRWNGDTNFMPVLGNVKIISESLDALYDILKEEIC